MNGKAGSQHKGLETQLIEEALAGLFASSGISGQLNRKNADFDGAVTLQVAGAQLHYICEVKRNIDRMALLYDIKARSAPNHKTLLVCTPLTHAMASHCHRLDLQFIDTAGNAFITNGEGILINIIGRKQDRTTESSLDKTITPAALRMMFAFLAQPSMLNAAYREIAGSAQVSTGVIGNALEVLEARGFIGTTAGGNRIINSPELMLSEWATGYTSRLRPKLKKIRFNCPNPTDLFMQWSPELRISAWSGEVAAESVTKHLIPSTGTIYMDMDTPNDVSDMVRRFKLRADPDGPIEVIQSFWNMNYFLEKFPNVPLHLVYADLLGSHDPRNLTVAKLIYQQVIDHVHSSQR